MEYDFDKLLFLMVFTEYRGGMKSDNAHAVDSGNLLNSYFSTQYFSLLS